MQRARGRVRCSSVLNVATWCHTSSSDAEAVLWELHWWSHFMIVWHENLTDMVCSAMILFTECQERLINISCIFQYRHMFSSIGRVMRSLNAASFLFLCLLSLTLCGLLVADETGWAGRAGLCVWWGTRPAARMWTAKHFLRVVSDCYVERS